MAKDKNKAAVSALIDKAVKAHDGQQAVMFSEAANNVAIAIATMKHADNL